MDAEDQPADTDKMKEQVVVSPVLSPSFLLFVSASMNKKEKKNCSNNLHFFHLLSASFSNK